MASDDEHISSGSLRLRVPYARVSQGYHRHNLISKIRNFFDYPIVYAIGWGWLLALYFGGLVMLLWWFMCGFVPTLPQPLPPIINWTILGVMFILAGLVDEARKR
jgi:hypothetical protein